MRALRTLQRGLAAVEMAIIMPVFLMLLLATAELGHACYQYNALAKSVRDGSRFIAARAKNGAGVVAMSAADIAAAQNLVVYGNPAGSGDPVIRGLDTTDVTIAEAPAGYITVTVAYPYVPVVAVIPTFGQASGDIAAVGNLVVATTMAAM